MAPVEFRQLLSATPRGARLARRLAGAQLAAWGIPYGCALAEDVELVVGELAANAVLHGRVPGRDFEVRLGYDGLRVRVEVSAREWGVGPRGAGGPGKTVWACV